MHRLEEAVPKETWLALQGLQDTYPQDTEAVVDYLDEVTRALAKMTQFLCKWYRRRDPDGEWPQAKERIEEACSLQSQQGEKILAPLRS